ncbi:neurotactin [Frieseomelitta varia]|uniref:neurotactin n=1 Tax=Frieseomelitta varia TaxID=561572 RepID=UPI001CB68316|nr:neurotactin [Frieseomelitta varia]XP_043521163.1 neurotactin [Frieseomelitta varia]XP_043521164.1 neurotactin [Frieseomelitta varia]XP_043521165.1 neurotactin [Frieseomelitta varia]
MSQEDQEKSMDKKEIAEEEREKMLNAENTKHTVASTAPDAESEDQKPKKKIPIGGIKMPGFCRTKSKELCKEDDGKPAEAGEGDAATEKPVKESDQCASSEKTSTPNKDAKEKEGRKGILGAIKLPLVSVFPRKKNKEGEVELGTTGAAGLASVETLDDVEKNPIGNEDGMETVRLDGDAPDGIESPKQHFLVACISAARRNLFVLVTTLCVLVSVVIIVCIACIGPRKNISQPVKDGSFVKAVTSCGPVQGVSEDGAFAFRGIPYAVPPLENRRWQPAEPLRKIEYCWTDTYQAHNSSKVCWQREASGRIIGSEDCLYLDVFTPEVRYDLPLPVVVMIGAETLNGGSPGVMQPSAKLARVRDMVFVRPNFRLGIFGFLAAEPLSRASHPLTSGNYGLSDIIAALQWVHLNIENFGGNKSAVVLWGHRAGGTLVTTLVGIRRTKDLFQRVWISSGSAIFPGRELEVSETLSELFLNSTRCNDAACLRSKSAEEVMDSVPETWHLGNVGLPETREATTRDRRHEWLVLDRAILQEPVGQIWARDEFQVKIVMGTTAHAGAPLKYLTSNATLNSTQVEKIVKESLLGTSGLADEALRRYNTTLKGLLSMISDIRVICPLLTVARMKTNIPFYVATQPRGQFADPDCDASAILGSYAARTPAEKRHVSAMQQLFNHYVWHDQVAQADPHGVKRVLIVGQDTLPDRDYPNCDFWIREDIVPSYGRVD